MVAGRSGVEFGGITFSVGCRLTWSVSAEKVVRWALAGDDQEEVKALGVGVVGMLEEGHMTASDVREDQRLVARGHGVVSEDGRWVLRGRTTHEDSERRLQALELLWRGRVAERAVAEWVEEADRAERASSSTQSGREAWARMKERMMLEAKSVAGPAINDVPRTIRTDREDAFKQLRKTMTLRELQEWQDRMKVHERGVDLKRDLKERRTGGLKSED